MPDPTQTPEALKRLVATIEQRLMPIPECGCWVYLGYISGSGYGRIGAGPGHKTLATHRVMYERAKGAIPEGLVLDHLCRVRSCCNPDHLEPVPNRTNVLRGVGQTARNALKTHCPNGHLLSGDNLVATFLKRGERTCKICYRIRQNHVRRKKRLVLGKIPRPIKGPLWTPSKPR